MNKENKYVLKGQHNLAHGNALGIKAGEKIVREKRIIEEKFLFRTKEMIAISRQIFPFNSVRKKLLAINTMFSPPAAGRTDGFRCVLFTQGDVSDRSSRNYALG